MTIQGVGTTAVQQPSGHHHGDHHLMKGAMDAAAQALGMSASDLAAALKGGTDFKTLAQQKGVSLDALTASMTKGAQAQLDQQVKAGALTQDQATNLAQRMQSRITRTVQGDGSDALAPAGAGGAAGRPRGGHHGGHKIMQAAMDAAAQALGMDSDALRSALQSGTSLKDLAQQKGISLHSLNQVMTQAMEKQSADDVQTGTATPALATRTLQRLQGALASMLGQGTAGGDVGTVVDTSA